MILETRDKSPTIVNVRFDAKAEQVINNKPVSKGAMFLYAIVGLVIAIVIFTSY